MLSNYFKEIEKMEINSTYVNYSTKLSESLDKLKSKLEAEKKSHVNKDNQLIRSPEITELISIGNTLSATTTSRRVKGSLINHGTFFDSVTKIKELLAKSRHTS